MLKISEVGPDPNDNGMVIYNIEGTEEEIVNLERIASESNMSINDYVVAVLKKAVEDPDWVKQMIAADIAEQKEGKEIGDDSDGPSLCR